MASVRVVLHPEALKAIARSPEARRLLQTLGDEIAADAAEAAPKRTGAGAASIHAEVVDDGDTTAVHVSWDSAHFYLKFAELGTSREPARPFLRPAAEKHRRL